MAEATDLWVVRAGRIPYLEAVELQTQLRAARQAELIPDVLLLLQHPPVYTRGRRTQPEDLPMGEAWCRAQGIEVCDSDRGGRVTYHGPGQLVGYPIMLIDDVLAFVRTMERALIGALADEGIEAQVREGLTGVWVDERKIGSIGIHVSRGVTTHGFAVNVDNDLGPFGWVVPCGIDNVQMTSVSVETGRPGGFRCFEKRAAHRFAEAYGMRQRIVSLRRVLGACAEGADALPAGAPARLESVPA